jgi:uncharacterized damage-inducible protein DinB
MLLRPIQYYFEMIEDLRRWLRYNAWGNRETLKSLTASSPATALKRMAHIVAAERLWLDRIEAKTAAEVWPELPLEAIAAGITENEKRWKALIRKRDADLARKIPYKNSKGEPWNSSVADIAQHVAFHSAYHRGQIASDVRAAGSEPAYTDFIHAVRKGFLD